LRITGSRLRTRHRRSHLPDPEPDQWCGRLSEQDGQMDRRFTADSCGGSRRLAPKLAAAGAQGVPFSPARAGPSNIGISLLKVSGNGLARPRGSGAHDVTWLKEPGNWNPAHRQFRRWTVLNCWEGDAGSVGFSLVVGHQAPQPVQQLLGLRPHGVVASHHLLRFPNETLVCVGRHRHEAVLACGRPIMEGLVA
jgi:hypothetical protein